MLTQAFIPYKGYYSSPFSRWQGSFATQHSIELGAATARAWLASRDIGPERFDYLILGATVGQPHIFYGGPWAAAMLGADTISGAWLSQACSTSTTAVFQAAMGIETGSFNCVFTLMTDRCSNGPHTIWPNPAGPGGQVISENWVMDQFNQDPWAENAMIQTAENVAKEAAITREQCDEVALMRFSQYQDALKQDRAFQKEYMFPVTLQKSKKKTVTVEADEGIMPTTAQGLADLRPVMPEGVHTFGSQTHPADGSCGLIVTTKEQAARISHHPDLDAQVVSYGYARAKRGSWPWLWCRRRKWLWKRQASRFKMSG